MASQVYDAPVVAVPPMRFLASAFDSNWRLKKNVPKDAIPVELRTPPPTKSSSFGLTSQTRLPTSLQRPHALQVGRPSTASTIDTESLGKSSTSEPETPVKTSSAEKFPKTWQRRNSVTDTIASFDKARRASLANAGNSLANADRRRNSMLMERRASIAQMLALQDVSADGREEKPLPEWAEEAGVPLDLAHQALDVFLEFISNPPDSKHYISREAILRGQSFDANDDLGSMDPEDFGNACCRIADVRDLSCLPAGFLERAMQAADKDESGDIDFFEFVHFYYVFCFSEEVLVGPDERLIRAAAREHRVPSLAIGNYQNIFERLDTNQKGRIAIAYFKAFIQKQLKLVTAEELPEKRIQDIWKAARLAFGKKGNGYLGKDLDFFVSSLSGLCWLAQKVLYE